MATYDLHRQKLLAGRCDVADFAALWTWFLYAVAINVLIRVPGYLWFPGSNQHITGIWHQFNIHFSNNSSKRESKSLLSMRWSKSSRHTACLGHQRLQGHCWPNHRGSFDSAQNFRISFSTASGRKLNSDCTIRPTGLWTFGLGLYAVLAIYPPMTQ